MLLFGLCPASNVPHLSRTSQKINRVLQENTVKVKRGVGENGFYCTARCDIFVDYGGNITYMLPADAAGVLYV